MTLTDEHTLIRRTQAGEPDAFNPVVEKYQARLYTHLHERVRDTEVAKDLSQETWLKAYRGIKRFRGDSGFSSWLYRIAENVCIDSFRKQKHDTDPLHEISERRITETHPFPSRDLLRAELRQHLRDAICQLTPLRRRVFLLY